MRKKSLNRNQFLAMDKKTDILSNSNAGDVNNLEAISV